jgi:hypothetical protein
MNNVEWLRPRELVDLCRKHGHQDIQLLFRLRQGLVLGRIRAFVLDATLLPVGGAAEAKQMKDWTPPQNAWLGQISNSDLDLFWDVFWTNAPGTGYDRVTMRGLSFSRADVLSYFEIKDPGLTADGKTLQPKPKGGRKPSPGWPSFAAALAQWIYHRDDTVEGIVEFGPEGIMNEVLGILATRTDDDFPRTTYQPAVQELIENLRFWKSRQ